LLELRFLFQFRLKKLRKTVIVFVLVIIWEEFRGLCLLYVIIVIAVHTRA
jgi:hypothetical protein